MIPGLSAHMPEMVVFSDLNGYDVETYNQIYNCAGFLMQVEIEHVHSVIWKPKKPVMIIKPMAAGRVSPFVGLTFSYTTVRPCDMVTVGCLTPQEAAEDIEISLAALERRPPLPAGTRQSEQGAHHDGEGRLHGTGVAASGRETTVGGKRPLSRRAA
jgi:hypothetical protein